MGRQRERQRKKRILLVEDHPLVRERLAEIIHQQKDLIVCGEAEDLEPAVEAIAAAQPDLVIVDLSLKRSHGLDLVKILHSQKPLLPILVVSMHEESLYAERVIDAGARGYVCKQEDSRNIISAIRCVLMGQNYFSDRLLTHLAAKMVEAPRHRAFLALAALTDRELRVFEMLGQGNATRQIAQELGLDIRTVETYRARIKEKLQFKDGNELLQHAIRWSQTGGAGE